MQAVAESEKPCPFPEASNVLLRDIEAIWKQLSDLNTYKNFHTGSVHMSQ